MLSIADVSKSFTGVRALRGVSFTCAKNEILGLIGPNGAGKSTLVNAISGVLKPDTGSIRFDNMELAGRGPEFAARLGVGRTFQNLRLFPTLTTRQNIEVGLITCRRHRPDVARSIDVNVLMDQFGLAADAERPAGTLPYGQQRRLELARAQALGAKLLLLDEPAAGMNDYETATLAATLRAIRDRSGAALLVIDHDLHFIMTVCDRICVLDMGEVVAVGPPEAIRRDPKVVEIYLGAADMSEQQTKREDKTWH
ncbi:ABC transporter ATP-binding protein [Taklimakanibacter deserti]|uniref:ABC transporter ATP-binding protein n=1 Tax=Taklimakanibacter deserti TaxID=2267839 RepID=UPI000E65C0D4